MASNLLAMAYNNKPTQQGFRTKPGRAVLETSRWKSYGLPSVASFELRNPVTGERNVLGGAELKIILRYISYLN